MATRSHEQAQKIYADLVKAGVQKVKVAPHLFDSTSMVSFLNHTSLWASLQRVGLN